MGALVVGWAVVRPDDRLMTSTPLDSMAPEPLNGWVMIDEDNHVTIVMSKAEMGQGVHTGAAMLLAEELDADWDQVRVVMSPIDKIYGNRENFAHGLPFRPDDHGLKARTVEGAVRVASHYIAPMLTGGSTSIVDLWLPMREAGASARAMLCSAAARQWNVPVARCEANAGRVTHPSGFSATFGELVHVAKNEPRPTHVELKDPARFSIIGQRLTRIEAPSKLDGTARFGIDALPSNLLYASVTMCPTLGGKVRTGANAINRTGVRRMKGVHGIATVEPYNGGTGGVAVIAENPYIAMRTLCQLKIEWDHGPAANFSSSNIFAALNKALKDDINGHVFYSKGNAEDKLKNGHLAEMRYEVPYLAHGTLEPVNCTVQVDKDSATVWVSTQIPMVAQKEVAALLNLPTDQVTVHQQFIGGGFGRRLDVDFITQAAAIAREVPGRPVQTIWSRPQDMTHDFYRPACVSRFKGALDANGKLIAWMNVSASQSIQKAALPRAFRFPSLVASWLTDATTTEGAFDQPYECENIQVKHNTVDLPIPVGYWRSVGHSHQAFFVESFLDEMATAAHKDPIEFRLEMLQQQDHRRHANVLRSLADLSSWSSPLKWRDKTGAECARGMAMHESFGSIVAQVAELRKHGDCFRVTRVFCVVDCGFAVNPNLVEQQMESGIIFGLSAALQQAITIKNGQVEQRYFSDYPLVDMETCPEICTRVLQSGYEPQGVGEAGTPPIAPAVANALFALTGCRHRTLPLIAPCRQPEGEDQWCQSVSTGQFLPSKPTPTPPCSGCFAANSD